MKNSKNDKKAELSPYYLKNNEVIIVLFSFLYCKPSLVEN